MIPRISRCSRPVCERVAGRPSFTASLECRSRLYAPQSNYATEAAAIPKSILLRQHPPPAPSQASSVDRQSANVLPGSPSPSKLPENEIDDTILSLHRHLQDCSNAGPPISELYDQLDAMSRIVLDEELPYEDTPSTERRINTNGPVDAHAWLRSCRAANQRINGSEDASPSQISEDGLVLVGHIVEAPLSPTTSWSLGFLVTTSEGNLYAISCSHTLESVSCKSVI